MMDLIEECYNKVNQDKNETCKESLGCNCFECCSNMYWDNNEINYECENKRLAYIVRYLPVHSSEIYRALEALHRKFYQELNAKKEIIFASFGGGPGTDIHAFNRWLNNYESELLCRSSVMYRIEACQKWTPLASEVINLDLPKSILNKYYLDIKNVTKEDIKLGKNFDIVTLSYLVSELDEDGIEKLIENIENNKSECSYILINDRKESDVTDKIEIIMSKLVKGDYYKHEFDHEHCGFFFSDDIYENAFPKVCYNSKYFIGKLK